MKFIDTYRLSPVVNCGDVPWEDDYFHVKPELVTNDFLKKEKYEVDSNWWRIQNDRCINGYTIKNAVIKGGDAIVDGRDALWYGNDVYLPQYDLWIRNGELTISGRFYFYLNFWWIYGLSGDADVKDLMRPRFVDMDWLFSERIRLMHKLSKDDAEPKARQKGFSEKGAGMVIAYNFTFIRNSVNIIIGGTDDDAEHTMDNVKRGLEGLRNTQFYKTRLGKSEGIDKLTKWKAKYFGSEIHQITAKNNEQAIARFSPTAIWWEEVGKWSKGSLIATKEYALPAMQSLGKKTGYNWYIGTGGDMDGGAHDLEEIAYNPKRYNCLEFTNVFEPDFTGMDKSTWFTSDLWMVSLDKDGNSNFAEAKQVIEKEGETKSPEDKYKHKTQHPIYLADCFYSSDEGYFGRDIIMKLHERRHYIRTHRSENRARRGVLEWIDKKNPFLGVVFKEDELGWIEVMEMPKIINGSPVLNLYSIGIDSYDQDEAAYSNSKGALVVRKRFYDANETYNNFCAIIIERPTTAQGGAEKFYEHCAMACVFYNNTQALVEHTKILIFEWFKNNGFESLLKLRPDLVTANVIANSKATNKYGIDASTKSSWLSTLRDSMTDMIIEMMYSIQMIDAFIKFKYVPGGDQRKYNCDITIAAALSVISDRDDIGVVARTRDEIQANMNSQPMRFIMKNGVLTRSF
jgi:hypothetical protein